MAQVFRARYPGICAPCQAKIEPGQPVASTLDEEVVHSEHHDDPEVRAAGASLGDAPGRPAGPESGPALAQKRSADYRSRAIAAIDARRLPKRRAATMNATCPSCRSGISVGELIERWPGGGWAHARCAIAERERLTLLDGRTFAACGDTSPRRKRKR
jgi:hypothetical protein